MNIQHYFAKRCFATKCRQPALPAFGGSRQRRIFDFDTADLRQEISNSQGNGERQNRRSLRRSSNYAGQAATCQSGCSARGGHALQITATTTTPAASCGRSDPNQPCLSTYNSLHLTYLAERRADPDVFRRIPYFRFLIKTKPPKPSISIVPGSGTWRTTNQLRLMIYSLASERVPCDSGPPITLLREMDVPVSLL